MEIKKFLLMTIYLVWFIKNYGNLFEKINIFHFHHILAVDIVYLSNNQKKIRDFIFNNISIEINEK